MAFGVESGSWVDLGERVAFVELELQLQRDVVPLVQTTSVLRERLLVANIMFCSNFEEICLMCVTWK